MKFILFAIVAMALALSALGNIGAWAEMGYFGIALGILVVTIIITCAIDTANVRYTASEKEELEKAKAKDAENKENNIRRAIQLENEEKERIETKITALKEEQTKLKAEFKAIREKLKEENFLSEDETNINDVEFLLSKLESGRADTLKEALLLLDEKKEKEEQERIKFEVELVKHEYEAKRRREQEFNQAVRDIEQNAHNRRMEEQAKEMNKTLEKIRRGDYN